MSVERKFNMNGRLGTYKLKKIFGESYKAYIPANLPPEPSINLDKLYHLLEKATLAIAELNNMTHTIPNTSLFMYMYVRKEALLSSQIEGTQSSFSDLILFEHNQKPDIVLSDVEEVSNYVKAVKYGLQRLKDGFPLSLRLIKEIHGILLSGSRGSDKLPGEFRRSQNWIGGTRPGNALFVPPPVENLNDCLSNLELFFHDKSLPVLIRAGVAHVQFETIHPFLDGNGRLGRLLIILLLCDSGMLDEPVLYLSLYLKQNRKIYYDLLQEVRMNGIWENWLEFFLEGVFLSSKQAVKSANDINNLFAEDLEKIEKLGRARFSCKQVFNYLKQLPQISVPSLAKSINLTAPTVRSSVNYMIKIGILEEISGNKRDKIYIYRKYINLLEEGAEPFSLT
jgi:cell filamentation protein, protein adenylyltransferase